MIPTFTLIIPTLNGHRRLVQVLNTAVTQHPFRLCLIDNADQRWSVAKSWNHGLHVAFNEYATRYAVVANDDILFHPDCLDALAEAAAAGHWFVNGQVLRDYRDMNSRYTQGGFSLFLMSHRLFEVVGKFDEAFTPAYYEDVDYFYRMKLAGIAEHVSPDAGFYHHDFRVNQTQHSVGWTTTHEDPQLRREHPATMARNLDRYVRKWGGEPGEEKFTVAFDGKPLTPALSPAAGEREKT